MPRATDTAKAEDVPTDATPEATGNVEAPAETAAHAADTEPTEVVTYQNWGPVEPDPATSISLNQIQLAEFFGDKPQPATQEHVTRLEDWLRSHAVGGSNRTPEGYFGDKTRELLTAANEKYTGRSAPIVDEVLWQGLKAAGAPVTT